MGSTLTFSAGAWLWPALAAGAVALAALVWGYRRAAGHSWRWRLALPVPYTHLTLPTILRV